MLPNFLIIGAAKAGTTSLYHYLRQHPQIYMSPHKEPRFFALEGRPIGFNGPGDMTRFTFVTERSRYEALFDGVGTERAIGEASPWYLYVEQSPERIKHHIPHARLIAVLRDPVERAYSNFLHARNEGLEPLDDFAAAMDAESERIAQNWSYRWHYKQKGFYSSQLKRYLNTFPKDNMRFYLFEDLKQGPADLLADICGFLDVDDTFAWETGRQFNVSSTPKSRVVADLLQRSSRRLSPVLAGAGPVRTLARSMKDRVAGLNAERAPALRPEIRARFIEEYREDVLRLQDLLARDLSAWLYA